MWEAALEWKRTKGRNNEEKTGRKIEEREPRRLEAWTVSSFAINARTADMKPTRNPKYIGSPL